MELQNENNIFEQELAEETERENFSVLSVASCLNLYLLPSLRLSGFA